MGTGDNAKTSVIADVDCTGEGKSLCDQVGVKGYPTIKWGDIANLEDYKGGRGLVALEQFAKENLKPICSPANIDLCDDAKKKEIGDLKALDEAVLEAKVEEKKKLMKDAEEHFKEQVNKLQDTYQKLTEEKDTKIKDVKESGLGLMSAVLADKKKGGAKE